MCSDDTYPMLTELYAQIFFRQQCCSNAQMKKQISVHLWPSKHINKHIFLFFCSYHIYNFPHEHLSCRYVHCTNCVKLKSGFSAAGSKKAVWHMLFNPCFSWLWLGQRANPSGHVWYLSQYTPLLVGLTGLRFNTHTHKHTQKQC